MKKINKYHILFDPLSYLSEERLPIGVDYINTPLSRSTVNNILIAHYQLPIDDIIIGPDTFFWIKFWEEMPIITLLVGCYLSRCHLAFRGNLLKLPLIVRKFIDFMPIVDKHSLLPITEDIHQHLTQLGYSALRPYIKGMPETLASRFPLSFPSYVDDSNDEIILEPHFLTLVSHYVEKNYDLISVSTG